MHSRMRFSYWAVFSFGLLLVFRLFFLQVVNADYYKNLAAKQYSKSSSGDFNRGSISFTRKDGELISAATLKRGYFLAINPKILTNEETVLGELEKIIRNINKDSFMKKSMKKDDPYEEVAHYLTSEEASKIQDLSIKGVAVYPESWRFYPGGSLASHVLGFIGYGDNGFKGQYGLEKKYEDTLERKSPETSNTNSFFELFLEAKRRFSSDNKSEGDIVLTIEPNVQSSLEQELSLLIKTYGAASAGGIIMDPKTGKIFAMGGKPDYDPNNYGSVENISAFINPSVQNVFEMGSIFKPLTIAAALDQNKITPEMTYSDNGYVIIDKAKISNFDGKARGVISMQEVLNQSINTGAIFAMRALGKDLFRSYMFAYGFGEKTGIDLPDELLGLTSNLNSPREVEYATVSFGQGIAVTPIQIATALSTLGNGGSLVKPYVVERIGLPEEKDEVTSPEVKRQVIKPETSEEITRMLVKVVDGALLGGTVKMDRYSIAAKTGTAQIESAGGGYSEDQNLHSFFGYFPAYDPQFLIFLYVEKPQGVKYASYSLTMPFMRIVKYLIN